MNKLSAGICVGAGGDITITRGNRIKILVYIFYCLIYFSCVSKKNSIEFKNKGSNLKEVKFDTFSISKSAIGIASVEINDFFNSKNEFDLIYYVTKSGDNEYLLKRWYFDNNYWHFSKLENGIKNNINIRIDEIKYRKLTENFNEKTYFNYDECYGCNYGNLLIKVKNKFFIYSFDGYFYDELSFNDKNKLEKHIKIFDFFNKQTTPSSD